VARAERLKACHAAPFCLDARAPASIPLKAAKNRNWFSTRNAVRCWVPFWYSPPLGMLMMESMGTTNRKTSLSFGLASRFIGGLSVFAAQHFQIKLAVG